MKREACTKKLKGILESLCTKTFMAVPRELYVFGSYARGAEEPGDLDLLLVYDLPSSYEADVERYCKTYRDLAVRGKHPRDEYKSEFRRKFSRSRIDITLDEVGGYYLKAIRERSDGCKIPLDELVLLWSRDDQDWLPKVNSIKVNPEAGRAPRDHFFDIKRLKCTLHTMEYVTRAIKDGKFSLTKMPIDANPVQPPVVFNSKHQRFVNMLGYRVTKSTPVNILMLQYGLSWLESEGKVADWGIGGNKIRPSEDETHAILLGSPLSSMLELWGRFETLRKACLIPTIHPRKENIMLIFERGPNFVE